MALSTISPIPPVVLFKVTLGDLFAERDGTKVPAKRPRDLACATPRRI